MKKHILLIQSIGLVLILSASTLLAQTNPAAHVLAAKSFDFNKSANGTNFAASMAGWSGNQVLEQPAAPTAVQADGDEPICGSCSPGAYGSSLINQGDLGINISRTAGNIPGRPLAVVIALNTIDCKDITISWAAAISHQNNVSHCGLQLQYRIGTTGDWSNVTGEVYETAREVPATFGPTLLPAEIEGQAYVQLRYIYFGHTVFNTFPRVRLDDVLIETGEVEPAGTAPTAAFGIEIENLKITCTDFSTDARSWAYDFGDGNTSTDQSPVHFYDSAGTYNVQLVVTNEAGTDTLTKEITVSDASPPIADFQFTNVGLDVSFTDLSQNDPIQWEWDFGDGSGGGADKSPSYTYETAGNYNVTLIVTNALGTDTITKEIEVTEGSQIPVAAFAHSANKLNITFTDQSTSGPQEWSWSFGDGSFSTERNPTHTYGFEGLYNVCLEVTNSAGTNSTCKELDVQSNGTPTVIANGISTSVSIFPNPTSGIINIDGILEMELISIEVYSLSGKKLISANVHGLDKIQLDLTSLNETVMMVNLVGKNKNWTQMVQYIK